MRASLFLFVALSLPVPWAAAAEPLSLLEAYDRSLHSDPAFQGAAFDYQASQQEESIGRAGLLPQISIGARYGDTKQLSGQDVDSSTAEARYSSGSAGLSARQVLFDKAKVAYFEQAQARGKVGEALYDDASQELFNRVSEAYFEVARQNNELKLSSQQKAAIEGLVKQTRRLYEAGDGTITDIEEAQARLDLIKAQEIENQARIRAALRTLAGRTGLANGEPLPMQESLPATAPLDSRADLEFWQRQARYAAPKLDARRASIELAEAELQTQKSGHYPSLAVVGELNKAQQDNLSEDYRKQSSYYVGLSLDVPLFAGGGVAASVRKSQYALSSASAQYDTERQQLTENIERDYLGVISGYEKCKALQTAVKSNQRALESAEKGYQAGVRSTVDILNAQQVLFTARRDLLNTKLLMLQSYVSLHARSGLMHRGILEQVQLLF
ncbi:TolC family outer membrane protein [Pseudomonas sp. J452]|uniref:TolC family outer membrane protein n=1 Tax=Pseudomonas sp. J452 TaxID=2898441 RepID=UPI0021AD9AD0|nr:TolC family outer membrane protein [Pseudomonas sp. J452]UUY09022.1 TolC family outer membrane protein [Pseudomonas sp. J452]